MNSKEISRIQDLATELACVADSLSMSRYALDESNEKTIVAIIDSIFAVELHIQRISRELDDLAVNVRKGGAA